MSAPETVAWTGKWVMKAGLHHVLVTSGVVASRHGIMRYDIKPLTSGHGLDMQSEFEEPSWGCDPGKTMSDKLWDHRWVREIMAKCEHAEQLELQPSGGTFNDLRLHVPCDEPSDAARTLWEHFCRLEGVSVAPPYDGAGGHQFIEDDLHDMISQGPVDNYANDPSFGSF